MSAIALDSLVLNKSAVKVIKLLFKYATNEKIN